MDLYAYIALQIQHVIDSCYVENAFKMYILKHYSCTVNVNECFYNNIILETREKNFMIKK